MPGKDFESQVQQKMNELNFVPSDAVWPEVERQIAGRKKRRVLIFWLLPFIFLLMGGAGWLYHSAANKENGAKETAAPKNTSAITMRSKQQTKITPQEKTQHKLIQTNSVIAGTTEKNIAIEKKIMPVAANDKKNTASIRNGSSTPNKLSDKSNTVNTTNVITGRDAEITAATSAPKNKLAKSNFNNTDVQNNPIKKVKSRQKEDASAAADDEAVVKASSVKQKNKSNQPVQETAKEDNSAADSTITGDVSIAKPFITKAAASDSIKNKKDEAGKAANNKAGIAKNKTSTTNNRKINWGLILNAGVSNTSSLSSGLLSGTPSYNPGVLYANSISFSNPGNSAAPPSSVKPAFSFSVGLAGSKLIGKNFTVVVAPAYSYYSTGLQVGTKITNSSSVAQYNTGSANNYTNRFHFIELPLILQKQLGKTSRFSVNAGLSLSFLVAGNALQYNEQTNTYYQDNGPINKTQVGLLAGAGYRLLQKKIRVEIGPRFNYNPSAIFKNESAGNRHLFFAGISTKIFLHHK